MSEATEREDMATTTAPVRDTIGAEQSLCETLLVLESNDGAPVLPRPRSKPAPGAPAHLADLTRREG